MKRATPRLAWFDALILGVAAALGCWLAASDPKRVESALGFRDTQAQFEVQREEMRRMNPRRAEPAPSLIGRIAPARDALLTYGGRALPIFTLGVAAATFRRRGAWSRRSLRRTGVLTTAVIGSFVAVALANEYLLRRSPPPPAGYSDNFFDSLWMELGIEAGLGVAALWAVLALGGVWRATPEGPDRLGRAVGIAWLVYVASGDLLIYLMPFSWV